ncbi:hypothetical protein R3W88_018879 [Solanum pinnatisectum]|uniref:Auxin efflux carrier component n=1 Tax=Solanum pinnatisectum TaxID=50273 RepID=A0AAV9KHY8_9SOLN|nr:hypothetical protein R3W88_018879 [Solanum pinnatisectum]
MINGKDIYDVLAAIIPLYVAMILAYGSVRWWKIFTPDQCSGINRFVAVFAVPLLGFHFISTNDPYAMNYHFIAADSLQKVVILFALFIWHVFSKRGSLEWVITLFSLSTLPNTLVMGIPLLKAMYGDFSGNLMVQIVVMQSVIWYTLMLFMFEYRGAKLLIGEQFPETAASITSFRVESDVISLNGREPLQADAEIGDDGKLHVIVRRSSASSIISSYNKGILQSNNMTPRASNLTGVEIYSVQSSREPTPRASSFNQSDFYAMFASKTASPKHGYTNSYGGDVFSLQSSKGPTPRTSNFEEEMSKIGSNKKNRGGNNASSVSKGNVEKEIEIEDGSKNMEDGEKKSQMPPASVMTRLILIMVWRKLIRNPNTYASLIGLIWSLVSFRWNIQMPSIVKGSISILSDAGLGMAMFSLGLFMALQPKIIACGKSVATFSMAVRFLTGPAVIAATSIAIGLRGVLLHVAIVQAALPQGIVPFVFAKEYNLHPDILSTAVIFGMLVALPITILYYVLLGV